MKYIKRTKEDINSNYVLNLLKDRGVLNDSIDNGQFFYPTKENECDPLSLDNMEEGFQLYLKHLQAGSKIRLYVDPDVDGFCSSAIFYNYYKDNLISMFPEADFSFHIPEGKEHGLRTVMDELTDKRICDLIVLPDSSSNDYEEHKILKEMGYDILVLDHHQADKYSEDAIVINNQLSKDYENKNASGAGVVYKFIEYCDIQFGLSVAHNYCDIAALAEISDMMCMETLENRYICDYGLTNINNPAFRALIKKQCYSLFSIKEDSFDEDYYHNGKLTQVGVSFYIAPIINALIRVGTNVEKELLFTGFTNGDLVVQSTKARANINDTETIAEQAARSCINARSRQNREKEKAMDLLDIQIQENCLDENKILILNADEIDVSNNLTGLIAMGIAAKYEKPTILGRTSPDGMLKGSLRGRDGSELKDFRQFLLDSELVPFAQG